MAGKRWQCCKQLELGLRNGSERGGSTLSYTTAGAAYCGLVRIKRSTRCCSKEELAEYRESLT
jgi:hypothetical protein